MTSEEQELARRRIYQAMIEQGMTPDQQQVVSGRVVPYHPIQGISKLAQAYMGRKGLDRIEEEKLKAGEESALGYKDALTTMQGIPGQAEGNPNAAMDQMISDPRIPSAKREAIAQALMEKQLGLNTSQLGSAYTRSQYEKRGDVTGLATYNGRTGEEISFDPGRIPVTQDPTNRAAIKQAEGEAVVPSAVDKASKVRQVEADVDLKMKPQIAAAEMAEKNKAQIAIDKPKRDVELSSAYAQNQNIDAKIDAALAKSGAFTTGLVGSVAQHVPGTKAFDLSKDLDTIKASIGLEALQDLRASGGTLGQVTEAEHRLLQDKWTALSQSQSREQFESNLKDLKKQVKETWNRVEGAYQAQYGKPYGSEAPKKRLRYNRETGKME